jgi:murein DD-endopeptidase MepM/ murein hydrolase activator NlpD
MRLPHLRRALGAAFLVSLLLASAAFARPDDARVAEQASAPPPAAEATAAEPAAAAERKPLALSFPAFGRLTSPYGPRWGRMHRGIDVGALENRAIVSSADGKVVEAGYTTGYGGYGIVIVIQHGQGYETLYAHLASVRVKVGQPVREGDWIGMAGCTGTCFGTHLHFELRDRGSPIDPVPFFRP